jgi:DNA-binding PadR family transcriptional regulator
MHAPADELLILLSHGLEGWMLGQTTHPIEIASFVNTTGRGGIPNTPQAVEGLLEQMETAGLVERRSTSPADVARFQQFHRFALTEQGWARAAELEADG